MTHLSNSAKKLYISAFAALLALSISGSSVQAEPKVVAKVGDTSITEQDMSRAETEMFNQLVNVPKKARRKVLIEYLIETQLLATAAKEAKISETDAFKSSQEYYHRRALRDNYFSKQVFGSVTPADIKSMYEEAGKQEEAKVKHILVKEEAKAKELHDKIVKGADFAALAKEHSIDPGSKAKGGELGYILKEQVVPSFSKAAFDLKKKGDISQPVKSQFGYHIIQLEEKRMRPLPPFDSVKERIKEVLWKQKAHDLIEGLRKTAKVEFIDKELEKPLETPRGSN